VVMVEEKSVCVVQMSHLDAASGAVGWRNLRFPSGSGKVLVTSFSRVFNEKLKFRVSIGSGIEWLAFGGFFSVVRAAQDAKRIEID
jgi:hypothetical protein